MHQPLSYVHASAKIADTVVIEPFVTIYKNVEIGEGSWIGSNVTIMENARIGKNVKIYPGAVISAPPQDMKFKGEKTYTHIGDNTVIRECVTINRGTSWRGHTKVGKNNLLMAYAHIAHDCLVGDNCILANNVALAGHVEIEDYAILAGYSGVHQFIKIGKHAYLTGGTLARKDVPPFVKAAREPMSYVGVNSVGLRRRGFTTEEIHHIQDIYRYIFVWGHNVSRALEKIEANLPATQHRDDILGFIRSSGKGIMKGFYQRNE